MGLLEDVIDGVYESRRFKETVFLKESSDLQEQSDALDKLAAEYPDNNEVAQARLFVKKGLEGEKEVAYRLKHTDIGMFVLHDVQFAFEDLTAQIDYIIVTPVFTYFVECKNLIGNITVTEQGNFIREYFLNGKRIKKGMNSPLTQVEDQREVVKKIWESRNKDLFTKVFSASNFYRYRKVLVVAANPDTILNVRKAPAEMKYKILRADGLVRQIDYDLQHCDEDEEFSGRKEMKSIAEQYLEMSVKETKKDFYTLYKEKYCCGEKPVQTDAAEGNVRENADDNGLRDRLTAFRTRVSKEMKLPPYYVFNNEELEKLLAHRPRTIDELKSLNILPPVKIKVHGEGIIDVIAKTVNADS